MNRTALWDYLLKQEDDVFAASYVNFNMAGKTPEMKSIPVIIEFVDGHVLRTSLEEAKFFDMPESHASIKIKQVSFQMVDDQINRLVLEGKLEEVASFVHRQYKLLAPEMKTAKGNVQMLVGLAKAIQRPVQDLNQGVLLLEFHNLCHSIENIAGTLFDDASSRYQKLKQAANPIAMAKPEISGMHDALEILSFCYSVFGARNAHSSWSAKLHWLGNYDYWIEYARQCELAFRDGRYFEK
jgi:hypothetical protein